MASVSSDPSSLSNPLQATVRHWHLDVGVDFTTKKLSGTVTAEIAVVGNEATNLVRKLIHSRPSLAYLSNPSASFN